MAHGDVVGADEAYNLALHAIDAGHDRDAGSGKARQVGHHLPVVDRHEHHGVGHGGQRLADQGLLLADIVGRLGHKVHGPRAGFGGDPVGGQAGGGIGRIDAVLGEHGEGEGTGHGPYFRRAAACSIAPHMAKPYDQISDRRAIVRRRVLEDALATLVEDLPTGAEPPRPAVLALLRDALAVGRAEIRRRFEEPGPLRNDGDQVLAATSFLMDQLIRVIFDFADQRIYPAANPSAAERLGVVATGGYGRGELAPLSDIDLLFLRPYKQTPRGEQIVEFMLYLLWDLGLKVGHATRTVDESLRYGERDQTIRTALLEARYVWGDRELFDELIKGFAQKFLTGDGRDFVEAKLAERDQRHQRMGDSRYVVEPNVKEGKGGLRDLHLLFWIAEYLYRVHEPSELVAKGVLTKDEARHFERAERFFTTVRCHIHYLTGRADDRLSFELQREIAARLGYQDRPGSRGVERFTKHYYLHAKIGRRPHAHLHRRARGQPPPQAQARRLLADLAAARARGLPPRRRAAGRRLTRRLHQGSGGDPAPVPCGAGERPRHPSRRPCG